MQPFMVCLLLFLMIYGNLNAISRNNKKAKIRVYTHIYDHNSKNAYKTRKK